jgi:hypothetical protein
MSKRRPIPKQQSKHHLVALAAAAALGWASPAQADTCTWNTTVGNWNALANWLACVTGNGSPPGVPGSADSATIGAAGVVTVNTAQRIGALTNAGSLIIDAGSLRVTGGLTGAGTTTIQGGGLLNLEQTQTVGGNATIVFGATGNNRVGIDGGGKVVTFAAGTTVRGGTGSIGLGQLINGSNNSVVNQGLVSSDSGGTITILGLSAGFANQNLIEATGAGSRLALQSDINNAGGTIRGTAGGIVRLEGAQITGGTITTSGGGSFTATNSASNVLSGVTLSSGSVIDLASAAALARVRSGMTLDGTVNVASASLLNFEGDQTLGGNGSIVFGAAGNNRVGVDGGGRTLTIGSGVTIRGDTGVIGQGQLVNGNGNALVNNGTIAADVAGGTISLLGLSAGITNNGTISALNGGTLALRSDLTGASGSQLVAGAGSVIEQQGVTISGVINTSGSGSLRPNTSGNNYLSAVTLNGSLDMTAASSVERVINNLALNGSINIDNGSLLNFEGSQKLSGTGNIVFGTTGNNRVGVDGGSKTLTIASGATISGHTGVIGQGQLVNGNGNALVNNGTISANVAGGTITLLGLSAGITNNGTISALNGGTLALRSDLTGASGSQLVAGAGSLIEQQGVTISGVINTSGSGSLRPNTSGSNYLSAVTLNGSLDMTAASSVERVINNLVLNGSININNGSLLSFEGNQTLGGTGNIVFGTTGNNRLGVDGGSKTLTIASGATIRGHTGFIGQGQLVNGSGNAVINQGLISSDSGGTLTILGLSGGLANQNILEATGAGSVLALQDNIDNATGEIRARAGGVVSQEGVRVAGGLISTSGGGSYRINGSGSNVLSGVTVAAGSLVNMTGGSSLVRVRDGMVSDGTVNVDNSGLMNFEGDQTLSGNGSIVFGAGGTNRVGVDGGSKTLTIDSGVTIRGVNGSIGLGQLVNGSGNRLVNNGTIHSDGGGTITVQGLTAGFTNNGLARAQNGTLTITNALTGTGTLQVDATGIMNLANGAKTQGRLVMGATGATLNVGTGNLTITNDYTNVGAGTGNSFNRRAGITGTGQIVAGGDVSQIITGAQITGGNTAGATLTIGNLRVGANTFNYQIGNAGTTGPTLRGAIQTNVNGGNLTDARLSGVGVTAANYNAGAPAGTSGNLGVTFTAANSGVLAPMGGQVLNLRSNFENIADQKLSIVLASGAAAYNAAVGSTTPSPVVVGNQRVGGSGTVGLTVANTAAAGAFSEDLRASFGANGGAAVNNGAVASGIVAGGSAGGVLSVGVNTATAGAKSGTVQVNYETLGTVAGVSNGLGVAGANAAQTINVSGNVYQVAAGALQTGPLNFGTLQVGQQVSQNLVVRNTASGASGFVEDLNARFGASGNSQITGAGSLSGITAGTNSTASNGSMVVTVTGASQGALNSSIAVNYFSAGAVAGVSNGLGELAVGSENFGVSGTIQAVANVINQASPLVNNPTINLGAVRVGGSLGTANVSVTNVATAAPQAALNASIAAVAGPITPNVSGSFNLLAPGATDNTSLTVGLSSATAGNFTGASAGQATLSFVSDASNVGNCAPNCQLNLSSQTVNIEAKVYTQAIGSTPTTSLNFGIVRVGDTVSARNIVVNNTAATSGLNDTLNATASGTSGPVGFQSGNTVSGIGAQGTGNIGVVLSTASAGVVNQTASVAFTSHNADMADVSAGAAADVAIFGQVNNYANAHFNKTGGMGSLSLAGSTYYLDYGTLALGDVVSSTLNLENLVTATGPQDELSGQFDTNAAGGLTLMGFNAFSGLLAGASTGPLAIDWTASGAGFFTRTITFNGVSVNADDPLGVAQLRTLVLRANVFDPNAVPLPGTLALVLLGGVAGWLARRRRVLH